MPLPTRPTIMRWLAALACSLLLVAVALMAQMSGLGPWVANTAILTPGIVLALRRHGAWRCGHRSLVVLAIAHMVHPALVPVFLIPALTWAQAVTSGQHRLTRSAAHLSKQHPTAASERKVNR